MSSLASLLADVAPADQQAASNYYADSQLTRSLEVQITTYDSKFFLEFSSHR